MRLFVFDLLFFTQTSMAVSTTCTSSTRREFSVKDGVKDRRLEDKTMFKTTKVDMDSQCFSECSNDCRCLSFNVCGQICQLNAGTRILGRNSLRVRHGCRYYDLPQEKVNLQYYLGSNNAVERTVMRNNNLR